MSVERPAGNLRLGVNIDHVATIRNARGGNHPDPVRAAVLAAKAGADGITAHLREDRRHISDHDIERLAHEIDLPLNLEMAATPEMLAIALHHKPHACCMVPEKREELTTEGGLDVVAGLAQLRRYAHELKAAGILVTFFIDPSQDQIEASKALGANQVELHTGAYCDATGAARLAELKRLQEAAAYAQTLGLEVHAGHGLNYETVSAVAAIPQIRELNIGHFLIGEAIMEGLSPVVRHMRALMMAARDGKALLL